MNRRKSFGRKAAAASHRESSSSSSSPVEGLPVSVSEKERIIFVLINAVGTPVAVELKTGEKYEGLLYTANVTKSSSNKDGGDEAGFDIVLHQAVEVSKKLDRSAYHELLVIPKGKIALVTTLDGQLFASAKGIENQSFLTDTDISFSGAKQKDRKLTKWSAEDDGVDLGGDETEWLMDNKDNMKTCNEGMAGLGLSGNVKWNQFEANKEKFGIDTSFNYELYTTKLDTSTFSKEQIKEAERIEKEILNSTSTTIHEAEERMQALPADYDEEARFGAVLRPGENLPKVPKITAVAATTATKATDNSNDEKQEDKTPSTATTATTTTTTTTTSKTKKTTLNLNPKAKAFKPNVNAKPFVPNFGAPAAPRPLPHHTPPPMDYYNQNLPLNPRMSPNMYPTPHTPQHPHPHGQQHYFPGQMQHPPQHRMPAPYPGQSQVPFMSNIQGIGNMNVPPPGPHMMDNNGRMMHQNVQQQRNHY